MPKFVRPCIPTTAKAIPRGDEWLYEPKLDGYRFQIVKDGRQVRLYSRNGHCCCDRHLSLAHAPDVVALDVDASNDGPGLDRSGHGLLRAQLELLSE